MDILSVVGLILGIGSVVVGNYLDGGHLDALLNSSAAFIVIAGTLGAVCLQTPFTDLTRALRLSVWVFFPPRIKLESGIQKMIHWSTTARKEGLLGLEAIIEIEPDPFAQKGLQLLVDGNEPESIRSVLEVDVIVRELGDRAAAKVFESMGGYAPTVGILGAVMGLIHVMNNLADPSKLGAGIATAFVATIYGVGLANLILLPVAHKIKSVSALELRYREMLIEGMIAIAEGDNPRAIELKLKGHIS
ncbi:MAG: flagellar motor protein [Gammaproteobacteria bacterium]|nr:MAG: flagellar motor protein [Gammaproteobacteria bacterium]